MADSTNVALAGSTRVAARGATRVADVDASARATVSIRLRRRPDAPAELTGGLSREEFAARFGAAPEDIAAVEQFARDAHLRVVESSHRPAHRPGGRHAGRARRRVRRHPRQIRGRRRYVPRSRGAPCTSPPR